MHLYILLLQLFSTYSYNALFVLILLAELGVPFPVPFPSELLYLFAGYNIYLKNFILLYTIIAGTLGDFLGSLIVYLVAYHLQDIKIVRKFITKLEEDKNFHKVESLLRKHTVLVILIGRMFPYLRYYVSVLSGVSKISFRKFFILSLIASLIWAGSIIYIGFRLGATIFELQNIALKYEAISTGISVLITGLIFFYIAKVFLKKQK